MAVLISFPAFAEDERRDYEVVRREKKAEERAAKTAAAASRKKKLEDLGQISYEQILAEPDNIQQNLIYAQQQAEQNNLLGAAAALERTLMIKPDEPEVRLFYAVVLFRLDNLAEAERELKTLDALSPPPSLKAEINRYLREIKRRKRSTRLSLRQSNGFGLDSNRNASPSSKHRLFGDTELDVSGSDIRRDDTHFLNITNVDVVQDLGMQGGHELFGNFTHYRQDQTQVDSLDIGSFSYELGGNYKTRWFQFTPSFEASHVFLSHQTFLRTQSGKFFFSKQYRKWDTAAGFEISRQDYSPIDENNVARERTGNQFQYLFGGGYQLTSSMRAFVDFGFVDKHAKHDYNAYRRFQMTLGHTWVLPRGIFAVNVLEPGWDFYNEPDVAIAGRDRRDKTFRFRSTIGAPLTTFGLKRVLPAIIEDITVSVSFEYFRAISTITNYTYTNNKFQTLMTKTFDF